MSSEQIAVLPIGEIPEKHLEALAAGLERILKKNIVVLEPRPEPVKGGITTTSGETTRPVAGINEIQYYAAPFLQLAHDFAYGIGKEYLKVLGVTDLDLYTDDLNFIFGQAEISGRAALISTARLRFQKFHSIGRRRLESHEVFIERMLKEAVHELGHTFGMRHCNNRSCVMAFSNCLEDTDYKSDQYCDRCRAML